MELIKVGEKTYYIKNPTNIGIYKIDEENVYIIDSGNDKDAGRKILKIIDEQGWKIRGIINTHSNADHIGGNQIIQNRTDCKVLAYNIERAFSENPILESSFLYGGYPFKDIRNKFLMAKESLVNEIDENLPEGLEWFELKGHFFDMIGIRTSDNIVFLADSVFSEETINKYHVSFIYDVREFLNTLNNIENMEAELYIPSHSEATNDIKNLLNINRKKVEEICEKLINICKNEKCFEDILKEIFDEYNLVMNSNQYVLVGSTIKSYLSYLYDENKLCIEFKENKMYWKNK